MRKKQRETKTASHRNWRPESAEKQLEAFYAALQQAIDEVDWGKVKLPELRDVEEKCGFSTRRNLHEATKKQSSACSENRYFNASLYAVFYFCEC